MALLKIDQFEKLGMHHAPHCYSIFLPTQRYGEEVLKGKDSLQFKKLLQETQKGLRAEGLSEREVDQLLQPAHELLEDSGFWRKLSDGLAVFGSDQGFWHFTLPIRFTPRYYLADHFYVKPLVPLFNEDNVFYVLRLSLHGAKFYEATPHTITEVFIEDITPARLEEVVGYDYEEKSLQFRSQPGGQPGAQFHGHGEANDKRKEEVLQYFRAVDRGLMQLLHDQREPLVVSCVDFEFPLYQEANNYGHLLGEHIKPQNDNESLVLLHERAWQAVAPLFESRRREKIETFLDLSATGKTATEVDDIVSAAIHGRIDTLFLDGEAELYGMYEPQEDAVRLEDEKTFANASLPNLAAFHTLRQQGKVFLMDREKLPVPEASMNALFRY